MEELWRNNNRERHKVFFSGKEDKHEHGVGFLVKQGHREHCHGMSPSLQQAHLPPERSAFQHHNSTSVRPNIRPCDNEIGEKNYDQLQNVTDQTPRKDTLDVKGDWNAKVGNVAYENWQSV